MKYILLVFSVLFFINSFSQVNVGSKEVFSPTGAGKISKEEFTAFKKTTTIFTLQFKDYKEVALWEDAIKKVWTVTPFKIVSPEELERYVNKPGYSFFTFGGYFIEKYGKTNSQFLHLSYDLWMQNQKNPKKDRWLFSKISLYVDYPTVNLVTGKYKYNAKNFSQHLTGVMYNDANIYNWGPGLVIGFLKTVNDQIIQEKTLFNLNETKNKQLLSSLKTDTLYVPDYVILQTNPLMGTEVKNNDKEEKLSDAYKYPIKFVSVKELNEMIIYGKPIKFLMYIRSTTQNWINVYDSGTGQLLYSEQHGGFNYNFRVKDLNKLEKAIN